VATKMMNHDHRFGERNFLRRSCLLGVKANVDILRVLG